MKKIFFLSELIFLFFLFSFGLISKTNAATCDLVTELRASPTSGDTNTNFTFNGQVQNCTSYNAGESFRLFSSNPSGSGDAFSKTIQTDNNGNFTASGVFPSNGTWYIVVMKNWSDIIPMATDAGGNPITVTVTVIQATRGPQCGEAVPPNATNCPASCPASRVEGSDQWKCGGGSLNDDLHARCNTKDSYETFDACKENTNLENVFRCGPNNQGFVCEKREALLCIQGEKNPNNVKCETFNPLAPPCSKGLSDPNDPDSVVTDRNLIKKCLEVDTGLGIIRTDVTGFIKSLYSILLGISGGIALLLIIISGYQLMASQGNPEKIQGAKETLTSAIVGLMFIIFSLIILQIIGVNILKIPGFT